METRQVKLLKMAGPRLDGPKHWQDSRARPNTLPLVLLSLLLFLFTPLLPALGPELTLQCPTRVATRPTIIHPVLFASLG